ncbi:MAG: hypothetical protein PHG03_00290 [Bacilli bacterium]|nr:hypothetical protein [Bacilli bacterium]
MLKPSARLFPIGYIISVDAPNFDPHDFYLDGNWERVKGRVIVGVDEGQTEFNTTGKTGGSKYFQKHSHNLNFRYGTDPASSNWETAYYGNVLTGSAQSPRGDTPNSILETGIGDSGNLPPYHTAYVWKLISYSN